MMLRSVLSTNISLSWATSASLGSTLMAKVRLPGSKVLIEIAIISVYRRQHSRGSFTREAIIE